MTQLEFSNLAVNQESTLLDKLLSLPDQISDLKILVTVSVVLTIIMAVLEFIQLIRKVRNNATRECMPSAIVIQPKDVDLSQKSGNNEQIRSLTKCTERNLPSKILKVDLAISMMEDYKNRQPENGNSEKEIADSKQYKDAPPSYYSPKTMTRYHEIMKKSTNTENDTSTLEKKSASSNPHATEYKETGEQENTANFEGLSASDITKEEHLFKKSTWV